MLEDVRYDICAMCRLISTASTYVRHRVVPGVKSSQWPLSDEVRFDGDAEVAG